MDKGSKLRGLLKDPGALLLPGVYDALSAKVATEIGFKALYVTGAGISNAFLGCPDIGLLTMSENKLITERIISVTDLPVIVDIDTGYGNAINLVRTVREFERIGVAGLQIEDQLTPKCCGHFDGKEIISVSEMVAKIQAAVDTRKGDILLIARTDARAVSGIYEALERATLYAEAGADITFIEAPENQEELALIADSMKNIPQMINMVEGGKTPFVPLAELEKMGFRIVLYANTALRSAVKAVQRNLQHLFISGGTNAILDDLLTWEERQKIVGLAEYKLMQSKYLKL